MKLHNLIFAGMIAGGLVGCGLWYVSDRAADLGQPIPAYVLYAMWWLDLLGPTLFLGALKMIFAPLILASIVAGVTSLPDPRELGSIGIKIFAFYLITTTVAVSLGIAAVMIIRPGEKAASVALRGAREQEQVRERAAYEAQSGAKALRDGRATPEYLAWLIDTRSGAEAGGKYAGKMATMSQAKDRTPGDIVRDSLVKPLLMNPFASLAGGNALGIIFFAILIGVACTFVGEKAAHIVQFFRGLNEVILQITHWVMLTAPLAVGCLMAKLVADTGPNVFASLGWHVGTVISGIAIHVAFLVTVAYVIGRVSPIALWKGIREAWLVAFTTRSSAATLPVTIENTTNNLGVSPKIANFALPIGATVNMDGTSLYLAAGVIFVIQVYTGLDDVSITLNATNLLLILVTAILASVGAAAVPSAALITMVIVASAVNLPIYYLTAIFAVDTVLDMFRTSTNILGDTVACVVVDRFERGRLGESVPQR